MRTRPHSDFVDQLKSRRCTKCNCLLNPQVTRCRRCHALAAKPKKKRRRVTKFRLKKK
jgi:ribosomal protein L40E